MEIVAHKSLSYLLNQMVRSQSTAAIVIAKINHQEHPWAADARILVTDQWFPVIGNVVIVAQPSLSYLLNQMVRSQSIVVIVIAIADLLDQQVDINNKKSSNFSRIFLFTKKSPKWR